MSTRKLKMQIEKYYQVRAKYLVDMLFDKGLFADGVSRDNMQAVEDLIAFEYQSSATSAKRCAEFMSKLNKGKND